MAEVILPAGDIRLPEDLDDSVTIHAVNVSTGRRSTADVRTYASGNRRAVIGPNVDEAIVVEVRALKRSDLDKLTSWVSRMVQYRDGWGTREWGLLTEVLITENATLDNDYVFGANLKIERVSDN